MRPSDVTEQLAEALSTADDLHGLVAVLAEAMAGRAKFDDFGTVMQFISTVADGRAFELVTSELTDAWTARGVGIEAVEPVLRFMELHPSVEIGSPGPLVHFVERLRDDGYVELLVESIARRPTEHTVWMLSRAILAATEPSARKELVQVMERARDSPMSDPGVVEDAKMFLGWTPGDHELA